MTSTYVNKRSRKCTINVIFEKKLSTFTISLAAGRSLGSFVRHFAIKSWKSRDLKVRITRT